MYHYKFLLHWTEIRIPQKEKVLSTLPLMSNAVLGMLNTSETPKEWNKQQRYKLSKLLLINLKLLHGSCQHIPSIFLLIPFPTINISNF